MCFCIQFWLLQIGREGAFWQLSYSGKDLAFSEPLGLHSGMAKVDIHRVLSTHLERQGSGSPTFEKKASLQGHIAKSGFKAYPLRVGLHVASVHPPHSGLSKKHGEPSD